MAKAKSKTKGKKSSQKTANGVGKTTSVVANTNPDVAVEVTPPKDKGQKGKMKKKHHFSILPASKAKKPEGNPFVNTIYVQSMGPGGAFLCGIIEQTRNKCGGFIGYCNVELREVEDCQLKLVFDCRISDNQYLRVSHECNEKVDMGYISKQKNQNNDKFFRCGFIGSPARKPMEEDEEREKKFRDEIERVMNKRHKKHHRPNKYEKWDYEKHSRTKDEYQSLDKVFLDSVVSEVIRSYFLPEDLDEKDAYEFLKKRGLNNLFSRKKDGRYCPLAIEKYNFPADVGEQSDYDYESEVENEDENDDGNAITGEEDNNEEGVE